MAKQVLEFKEKPDEETAKRYLASGEYSWNSGMFVWKASTILEKFKELLPEIYACLEKIGDAMNTAEEARVIAEIYPMIPSISIDYGILEKSSDVLVISAEFGWNDVGSWDNLGVLYEEDENGNVLAGNQINIDTKNCISLFREAFDCHCGCGKSDHRGDGGCRSGVRQVPCPGCETDCGSVEGGAERNICRRRRSGMNYREAYEKWCTDPYFDADTKAELAAIASDEDEIQDRFYRNLEFEPEAPGRYRSGNQSDEYLHGTPGYPGAGQLHYRSEGPGEGRGHRL